MLKNLLDGTGVMSALDHSKIEGANDPESLSVDAQAARVAKRAADALRRSRAQVQVRILHHALRPTNCYRNHSVEPAILSDQVGKASRAVVARLKLS